MIEADFKHAVSDRAAVVNELVEPLAGYRNVAIRVAFGTAIRLSRGGISSRGRSCSSEGRSVSDRR